MSWYVCKFVSIFLALYTLAVAGDPFPDISIPPSPTDPSTSPTPVYTYELKDLAVRYVSTVERTALAGMFYKVEGGEIHHAAGYEVSPSRQIPVTINLTQNLPFSGSVQQSARPEFLRGDLIVALKDFVADSGFSKEHTKFIAGKVSLDEHGVPQDLLFLDNKTRGLDEAFQPRLGRGVHYIRLYIVNLKPGEEQIFVFALPPVCVTLGCEYDESGFTDLLPTNPTEVAEEGSPTAPDHYEQDQHPVEDGGAGDTFVYGDYDF